jgi:hypothetical protein
MTRDLTKEQQRNFLDAFQKHGIKAQAAFESGIRASVVNRWIEEDSEFKDLFTEAEGIANAKLRYIQWERGAVGWDEPIVFQGTVAMVEMRDEQGNILYDKKGKPRMTPATIRKFDNKLLVKENEARNPDIYKKRFDVTTNDEKLKTYVNFPMEDI